MAREALCDTRPVPDDARPWRLRVEPDDAVLGWLQSELELAEPPRVVRRCGGGIGASTHLLRSGDVELVVKQYPVERVEAVRREWDGLQLAATNRLAAPTPLAVDPDGSTTGLPAIAMTFVRGEPDLQARDVDGFVGGVAALLASVHHIEPLRPLRAAEPVREWRPPAVVPDGLLPADLTRTVLSRAAELAPLALDEDPVVNHGDLHPGNLLWSNGKVAALLDWSHLRLGTRSAELAYFRIELAVLVGWDAAEMLAERYQQRVGPIANLTLRDLLHVYSGHCWAHTWLEGWHEQGRSELSLADVSSRLAATARAVLDSRVTRP